METLSKKRGRPTSLTEREIQSARAFADCSTCRGLQNWAYQTRALVELLPDDKTLRPYSHFLPSHNDIMSGTKKVPQVLLSEIGRLPFDWMKPAAKEVCDRRLSAKDAIKYVKQLRLGYEKKPFIQFDLVKAIASTIDSYIETHDSSFDQVLVALQSVSETVSELREERHGQDL